MDPSHELCSEDSKKIVGKIKLETAPDLDLEEAVLLTIEFYSLKIKQNSSLFKHKGVQDHVKNTLENYIYCLEKKEMNNGVNHSFRSIKHEISMVRQRKIAL